MKVWRPSAVGAMVCEPVKQHRVGRGVDLTGCPIEVDPSGARGPEAWVLTARNGCRMCRRAAVVRAGSQASALRGLGTRCFT